MILLFKPDGAGSAAPEPARRRAIPDFQMARLDGQPWKLSDQRGKVLLLNFWASWCGPCRRETPGLVRLARDYGARGLEVAGVSMDENTADVHRFIAQYRVPYPILLPPAGNSVASGVESLPTTLLIDRQGRVARSYLGAESESVFRRDVERLLAER